MSVSDPQIRRPDHEMVPRVFVKAMFALMAACVALVTYAQVAGVPNTGVLEPAPIVAERAVVLTGDRARIYTVWDGDEVIAMSSDDRAGFIGVVGITIERQRALEGIPMETPIRIVRRENGHVAIIDDATGETTELVGYGPDNVAAFATLLD